MPGLSPPPGVPMIRSSASRPPAGSAHDFVFVSLAGREPLPLSRYRGRVLLIVNTASRCGFTPQYAKLQALHERYRDRGLVVIGVPSNDFGGQEPGSEAGIARFCAARFGVSFPLTAKVRVRGPDAHPFYRWARAWFGFAGAPRWNFHKYLVARDGRLVDYFHAFTPPDAPRLIRAVEAELARQPA